MSAGSPSLSTTSSPLTIDDGVGMEAKSRTDLMVIADDHDDELGEAGEAVNAEYADMCRLGGLDRARGEAGGQIKAGGLGWRYAAAMTRLARATSSATSTETRFIGTGTAGKAGPATAAG